MFGIRGFLMKDELYKSFVEELYNRLDKDRYPTTIETLCYIVDMAIMILIKSMAMYYQNPSEKETIIQNQLKQALDEARLSNEIISAIAKSYCSIYRIDV